MRALVATTNADEADADDLRGRGGGAEHRHAEDEDDHGSETARDRVHDRHLAVAVGGRQQPEVEELKHGRHGDVRPDRLLRIEAHDRNGREDDDRDDERDRRRGLGVALTSEDQVPECMEERRPEREGEGVERHRGDIVEATQVTPPTP